MSPFLDERINIARRLIAERCIYGVDINPLAVELAKLSLWLITISKGRPFGYLDHNLKSGDSLLGVYDAEQLKQANLIPIENDNGHLFSFNVVEALNEVAEIRNTIRNTNIIDINDIERMKSANSIASLKIQRLLLASDLLVGKSLLNSNGKTKKQTLSFGMVSTIDNILAGIESDLNKLKKDIQNMLDTDLPLCKNSRRPFHWLIEYPEVFMNGGFDVICGNPPFIGGKHLTGSLGTVYRNYLMKYIATDKGTADLVAYFYLRAYSLLREKGIFGLIACNTIAEGDTRIIGLEKLLKIKAKILSAYPNMPWPGTASVAISPVFLIKSFEWYGKYYINDKEVSVISAFLSAQTEWTPKALHSNRYQSYIGSVAYNSGFIVSEEYSQKLIQQKCHYSIALLPYLIGDDLNSTYNCKPNRWIIDFWDWPLQRIANVGIWQTATEKEKKAWLSKGIVPEDYPGLVAKDFPELLDIVIDKVKPERAKHPEKSARERWWQHQRTRGELYQNIGFTNRFAKKIENPYLYNSNKLLVTSRHTRHFAPLLVDKNYVYSDALVVFVLHNIPLMFLSSTIFQIWAWKQGSRLGASTLRFSPTDCFETFPFPGRYSNNINKLSDDYDSLRVEIMNTKKISFTDLYNQFNQKECDIPEIKKLRNAQIELDYVVLQSYGWDDLKLCHDFYEVDYLPSGDNVRFTISEESRIEIMKRLLALNKERWEEEQKTANK